MNGTEELEIDAPDGITQSDRLYQNIAMLTYDARSLYASVASRMDVNEFFEEFVQPTREFGQPTANFFFETYKKSVSESGDENNPEQRTVLVPLACAHIGEALRFADDGFREEAWESLVMAQYTIAKLSGVLEGEKKSPEGSSLLNSMAGEYARHIISERARTAADASHIENRANRKAAEEWLDDNFDALRLTNDDAAERLGKIVTGAFSTRLGYVKKWRKSR